MIDAQRRPRPRRPWRPRRPTGLLAAAGAVLALGLSAPEPAEARSLGECQLAWSKAVRSYLTTNRRAAPDGTVPEDMDAMEAAAEQWMRAFRPACDLEAAGDKPSARVEAALLGVKILAELDPRGCARFLEYYMESTRSTEICRSAAGAAEDGDLRRRIGATIP